MMLYPTWCFSMLLVLASSWQLVLCGGVNWCYPSHGVDYCTTTPNSILVSFSRQEGQDVECQPGLKNCSDYEVNNTFQDGDSCRTLCKTVSPLLCNAFTFKKMAGTGRSVCYFLDSCDSLADPDDQSAACTPGQGCDSGWKCEKPTTDCPSSPCGVAFDGAHLNARHWMCLGPTGRSAGCDLYARNQTCPHKTLCKLSMCNGEQSEQLTCSNGLWQLTGTGASCADLPCPCPLLKVKSQPGILQLACSPAPPQLSEDGSTYQVAEGSCALLCSGRLERRLACSLGSGALSARWVDQDSGEQGPFECLS